MATTFNLHPFFRWSTCVEENDDDLEPPPEFIHDEDETNAEDFIITSTQADIFNNSSFPDSQSPVPKKIRLHKEKLTIQDAVQAMKEAGTHAEAAEALLSSLADRTFSNVSGDDLDDLNRKQSALVTKLWKLNKQMKERKFQHKISKDPSILDATFAAKEDFSFFERLKPQYESLSASDQSSRVDSQSEETQSESPDKEIIFRKKLSELKDWKYIMERSKNSYEAVKKDAVNQGVSTSQLLALHSYRENYSTNRKLARMHKKIFEGIDILEHEDIDLELSLHIVERMKLGKGQFRNLRSLLRPHLSLPDYSKVSALRRSFCPDLTPYMNSSKEAVGVCASLSDCLVSHIQRLLQSDELVLTGVENSLVTKVTVGIDGRGDEKEYQQRSQVHLDTSHCTSTLFFVSAISELPTFSTDCVECYRDPRHPVCSRGDHLENQKQVEVAEGVHQEVADGAGDSSGRNDEDLGGVQEGQQVKFRDVDPLVIEKPKHFQISGNDVWVERSLGNVRAARPLVISQQRETRANVQELVQNYLEDQLRPLTHYTASGPRVHPNMRNPFIMVAQPDGKIVPFSADISFAAMDNKLVQTLTGRTGAFCTACKNSAQDMKNIELIAEGFYMDFGTEDLTTKFLQLAEDLGVSLEEQLPSKRGDYTTRLGMKSAPLTDKFEITKVLSVLHAAKLRAFPFLEEIILRDLSGCRVWGAGRIPVAMKERYEGLKSRWKVMLGPLLGFRAKQAPNQVTGFLCDSFLSQEKRPAILEAIGSIGVWREESGEMAELTELELENYRKLLECISVIGRVAASSQKVKVLELRRYCQDYHIFLVTTWPWILFSESVHRLVDHLWEFILLNKNYGLACQSEQSLEGSHKVERSDRENLARKTCLVDNLTDVFRHKWADSDPVLRSFDRKPCCKLCPNSSDHWTVSCPKKRVGCEDEDDSIVGSFLLRAGEVEPLGQIILLDNLMEKFKE